MRAMLLTGTLISAASILEWRHLVTRGQCQDGQPDELLRVPPRWCVFFVLRLTIFAGVIYGSLKCFQGSVVALLCGLGLAAFAVGWEVIRLLRD